MGKHYNALFGELGLEKAVELSWDRLRTEWMILTGLNSEMQVDYLQKKYIYPISMEYSWNHLLVYQVYMFILTFVELLLKERLS